VVFYLRAIEYADGRWVCKRGREELGAYETLDEAIASLNALGGELGGEFEVRVHPISVPSSVS
jgi:hypothetical protein